LQIRSIHSCHSKTVRVGIKAFPNGVLGSGGLLAFPTLQPQSLSSCVLSSASTQMGLFTHRLIVQDLQSTTATAANEFPRLTQALKASETLRCSARKRFCLHGTCMAHYLRSARAFHEDILHANQEYDKDRGLIGDNASVSYAPRNFQMMHVKMVSTLSLC
jgi:hypothetical protein